MHQPWSQQYFKLCKEGWTPDPAQQDRPGNSEAQCCTQECALFDHLCPKHMGVQPKRRCEQGRNVEQPAAARHVKATPVVRDLLLAWNRGGGV
eukprot:Skav221645  [mRNA]  locus=scaffold1174:128300:136316:- [translate_table: standard]